MMIDCSGYQSVNSSDYNHDNEDSQQDEDDRVSILATEGSEDYQEQFGEAALISIEYRTLSENKLAKATTNTMHNDDTKDGVTSSGSLSFSSEYQQNVTQSFTSLNEGFSDSGL